MQIEPESKVERDKKMIDFEEIDRRIREIREEKYGIGECGDKNIDMSVLDNLKKEM